MKLNKGNFRVNGRLSSLETLLALARFSVGKIDFSSLSQEAGGKKSICGLFFSFQVLFGFLVTAQQLRSGATQDQPSNATASIIRGGWRRFGLFAHFSVFQS